MRDTSKKAGKARRRAKVFADNPVKQAPIIKLGSYEGDPVYKRGEDIYHLPRTYYKNPDKGSEE